MFIKEGGGVVLKHRLSIIHGVIKKNRKEDLCVTLNETENLFYT